MTLRNFLLCFILLPSLVTAKGLRPGQRAKMNAALTAGRTAFQAGNYQAALARIQEALPYAALLGTTDQGIVRRNMARCYQALGYPSQAIEAHQSYLVLTESDKSEREPRRESRKMIERLRSTGVLVVHCGETTAQISIKGAPALPCPATFIDLPAKPTQVTATSPDGPRAQQTFKVQAGERLVVNMVLPGMIDLVGVPQDARLWVDAARHIVSVDPIVLDAGQHVFRVDAEGYKIWERSVGVKAGQRFVQVVELRRPIKTGISSWALAGIAAGGVAVLVGSALLLSQ